MFLAAPVDPAGALVETLTATEPTRKVLRFIGLDFVGGIGHLRAQQAGNASPLPPYEVKARWRHFLLSLVFLLTGPVKS